MVHTRRRSNERPERSPPRARVRQPTDWRNTPRVTYDDDERVALQSPRTPSRRTKPVSPLVPAPADEPDGDTCVVAVVLLLLIVGMLYLSYRLDIPVTHSLARAAAPPAPRGWTWRPLGYFSPF